MTSVLLALLLFVQGTVAPAGLSGTISGLVLNLDGTPAANIRVTAQTVAESPTAAAEAPVLASLTQTDANGRYRLENVTPGRYYIGAGLVQFPSYYPGVTALASARVVTITGGPGLAGIDFNLARPLGLKVSGRVLFEGGVIPSDRRTVNLSGSIGRFEQIRTDGTFEITNVPPGRYTIGVFPGNMETIVVDDKDVQVNPRVPLTVPVTGRITVTDDGPRPGFMLWFVDGATTMSSYVGRKGVYSGPLRPGNYRVTVGDLPAGYSVKSITSGNRDLTVDALSVAAGETPQFEVTLGVSSPPPWVRVSGRIQGYSNAPPRFGETNSVSMRDSSGETLMPTVGPPVKVSGRVTNLTSADGTVRLNLTGLRGTVGLDANPNGEFEFPEVFPGAYTLLANTDLRRNLIRRQVDVGARDIAGLAISFPPVRNVATRITVDRQDVASFRPNMWFTLDGKDSVTAYPTVEPDGSFRTRLPEGEWRLTVGGLPPEMTVQSVTYGATNLRAQLLKVTANDTAELRLAFGFTNVNPLGKLSGRLIEPLPLPATFALSGPIRVETPLKPDGTFEFAAVLPGIYFRQSTSEYSEILIPNRDVTDLTIRAIKGRVVFEGVTLDRRVSITAGNGQGSSQGRLQPDGSFILRLPSGTHQVSATALPGGTFVKSIRVGVEELNSPTLTILPDKEPGDLLITIAKRP